MNKAITDIQGAQGIATAAANSGGMVVSPSLEARVTVMQPNSQAESSQTTSV